MMSASTPPYCGAAMSLCPFKCSYRMSASVGVLLRLMMPAFGRVSSQLIYLPTSLHVRSCGSREREHCHWKSMSTCPSPHLRMTVVPKGSPQWTSGSLSLDQADCAVIRQFELLRTSTPPGSSILGMSIAREIKESYRCTHIFKLRGNHISHRYSLSHLARFFAISTSAQALRRPCAALLMS